MLQQNVLQLSNSSETPCIYIILIIYVHSYNIILYITVLYNSMRIRNEKTAGRFFNRFYWCSREYNIVNGKKIYKIYVRHPLSLGAAR